MTYDYDILSIGMGPAGMAVSAMGAEMGFKVGAIEPRALGGECMNIGCIPSKALLRMGAVRHAASLHPRFALAASEPAAVGDPFGAIAAHIRYINEAKTRKMFDKVDLILGQGSARFVDAHTVAVGERRVRARKIFINVGSKPVVPPIPGIDTIDILTNENVFDLDAVPESMVIIGGGAIGCEMAQAFKRLGCQTTIVHMDPRLVPFGDADNGRALEEAFTREGIGVYNGRTIARIERTVDGVAVFTDQGERLPGARLLVAAGRRPVLDGLALDRAGVGTTERGWIRVDRYLRTDRRHIFACGDCNGHAQFSHAAMHQGMIAIMNAVAPWPMKQRFDRFVVPWTVFTEPQVSWVGATPEQLRHRGVRFEEIRVGYEDYGAAIAEGIAEGQVKVLTDGRGRLYGAGIIGEGSGEMINEWGLAIQKKLKMTDIMFLQHSFPAMSFLSKRVAETWMMGKMKKMNLMKTMMKAMFRIA